MVRLKKIHHHNYSDKMSQVANTRYDYLFKVILIGTEEDVKSGLLWAFTGNSDIITDYKQTIGVNFGINSVYLNETTVKLQIWDISYATRVKYLRPLYFKGASGCIMVIRNLKEAELYLEEIKIHCNKPVPVFFIHMCDEPLNPQIEDTLNQINIEIVESGIEGIEWLAETMLSHRTTKTQNQAAIYTVSTAEVQETINTLYEEHLRSEMARVESIREKRAIQLEFIRETLREMEIPIVNDIVQIFSSEAFFEVNIITGDVEVFPLKCEQCEISCKDKRHGRLCIIRAYQGWSSDLDQDSLLILSSIYALVTNQIPKHIRNQIRNILRCNKYRRIAN